ncbi:hypothetical protein [Mucilaginibacter sp. MD40]|uniref:hypothetical protein n=1 Tax=Mucilaginibacter sp. MD40 TaxID=2029590 RepID=UPI00117D6E68|nr:hypothetical protein [Mucilaginibacter sp. MD40]
MKRYLLTLLVIVTTCCNSLFAQIDTVNNIPMKDKLYGLSKFWSEASQNFAYFEVDKTLSFGYI